MKNEKLAKSYRVDDGKDFRLKDYDPTDTDGWHSKEHADQALQQRVARLAELQDKLYAQDRWAVLLIFQGMDAAGKDGAINHVMSGVNPEGCQVYSFKTPTEAELQHDFLWRTTLDLPQRGRIGIFNRSYYEEVLIVRVHPELLRGEALSDAARDEKAFWRARYRFLARIDEAEKNWKFSLADIEERKYWDDYMRAYEKCLGETTTEEAPW